MADTAAFTIGAQVSCSDGAVGKVSRVVVDPVAKALTHLVVEPGFRQGPSRLVPLDLVIGGGGGGEVRLSCTKAEFENLEPAEETKFIRGRPTSFGSFGAGDVLSWPYYGAGGLGDLDGIGGVGGMGTKDGSPIPRKVTTTPCRWAKSGCAAASRYSLPTARSATSRGLSFTPKPVT